MNLKLFICAAVTSLLYVTTSSNNTYAGGIVAKLIATEDPEANNQLRLAAIWGDIPFAKDALMDGANVNAANEEGATPLHGAAWYGQNNMIDWLIDNDAKVNVEDNNGETPFHWAMRQGHIETVKLLIKHNAKINTKNKEGKTPLYTALYYGHKEIAELLIGLYEEMDVSSIENYLEMAIRPGYIGIVQILINRGAVDHIIKSGDVQMVLKLAKECLKEGNNNKSEAAKRIIAILGPGGYPTNTNDANWTTQFADLAK